MGLIGKIIGLLVIIVPQIGVWYYFHSKKIEILQKPVSTNFEIANRNLDLKEWRDHYTHLFAKWMFPALIVMSILDIGDVIMDKKDEKISQIESDVKTLHSEHGKRIKNIEDCLFPPSGPTGHGPVPPEPVPSGPPMFQRVDIIEKRIEEVGALLVRVTDPNPQLRLKLQELEEQIKLLRREMNQLKKSIPQYQLQCR